MLTALLAKITMDPIRAYRFNDELNDIEELSKETHVKWKIYHTDSHHPLHPLPG